MAINEGVILETAPTHGSSVRRISADRRLARQLARSVAVSAVAFAADFTTMAVLLRAQHLPYLAAATAGFTVGLVVNYVLSRTWVFADAKSRFTRRWVELGVFAGVGVVGLLLNDAIIAAVTQGLGLDPLLSKLIATILVFFWNFLLRRHLIFR